MPASAEQEQKQIAQTEFNDAKIPAINKTT